MGCNLIGRRFSRETERRWAFVLCRPQRLVGSNVCWFPCWLVLSLTASDSPGHVPQRTYSTTFQWIAAFLQLSSPQHHIHRSFTTILLRPCSISSFLESAGPIIPVLAFIQVLPRIICQHSARGFHLATCSLPSELCYYNRLPSEISWNGELAQQWVLLKTRSESQ